MWTCKKCSEKLEETFDACWQCGELGEITPPRITSATDLTDKAQAEESEGDSPPECPEPDTASLLLEGNQGKRVVVEGDVVRIEKDGLFTGRREKTLPIRNISSVEVKRPGAFVGFIQFSIAGGRSLNSSYTMSGGAFDAVQDENSVVFSGSAKYQIALQIKAYVENWAATPKRDFEPPAYGSSSVADEIRKLKALVDDGLPTPKEFERQKRRLLGM